MLILTRGLGQSVTLWDAGTGARLAEVVVCGISEEAGGFVTLRVLGSGLGPDAHRELGVGDRLPLEDPRGDEVCVVQLGRVRRYARQAALAFSSPSGVRVLRTECGAPREFAGEVAPDGARCDGGAT